MRDNLITFIKAWLAGIFIAIGCNVYLMSESKYVGATLFSLGLMTILLFGFNLYTGKVGYAVQHSLDYIHQLIIILLGNCLGCACIGLMFPSDLAQAICESKLQIPIGITLCKAIMCGILMFVAVDAYRQHKTLLPTIFCVAVFILSGYEHSIADVTYIIMGRTFTIKTLLFIATVIIGNTIGGMIVPLCNKIITKLTKQNEFRRIKL